MKYNQVKDISTSADLIPTKGIGEVTFGMNSYYLRDFIDLNYTDSRGVHSVNSDKKLWKTNLDGPFFQYLELTYKECLTISINLFKGEVGRFSVRKGYTGKVFGLAGIGDRVKKFYKRYSENFSEFEDDIFYFFFENRYWLGLRIGSGMEYEDFPDDDLLKKYMEKRITEIYLFDDAQRIGIKAELPPNWEHL